MKKYNIEYALCFSAFFFFYFSMGVLVTVLSVYLADIGFNASEISIIVSATAIFTLITQTFIGLWADHSGRPRRTAIIIMLTAGICGILICESRHLGVLFLLNGLAQSFIIGTVPLLDNLAVHTGFRYGSVRIGGSLGYAAAAQISSIVYDYAPYKMVFLLYGISVLLTATCLFFMKELQLVSEKKAASETPSAIYLIHNKAYMIFLGVSFIVLGLHYANIAYMPLLIRDMGAQTSSTGTILLLQTLFELPVFLSAERAIQRFSFRFLLIFVCSIMAIRMLWYSTYPDVHIMTSMFFFQGLTTGLFYALTVKLIVRIVDKQYTNTALAVASMTGKGAGALFFQLGGGIISEYAGYGIMYFILGIAGCISIIISAFYNETQ